MYGSSGGGAYPYPPLKKSLRYGLKIGGVSDEGEVVEKCGRSSKLIVKRPVSTPQDDDVGDAAALVWVVLTNGGVVSTSETVDELICVEVCVADGSRVVDSELCCKVAAMTLVEVGSGWADGICEDDA